MELPRDVLSEEIHERKRMTGRGGADNLGKEVIEKIARELRGDPVPRSEGEPEDEP